MGPIWSNIFFHWSFSCCQRRKLWELRVTLMIILFINQVDDVISDLQLSKEKLFRWFSDNQTKGNTDKWHLIISTNNTPELEIGDSLIKTSTYEKLLGVKIDYILTFDNHVSNFLKKANNKWRALPRAAPYMTIEKRKLLVNSFFNSQLNYCPLYMDATYSLQ